MNTLNTLYTLTVKKGSLAIYSQGVSPLFIRFDGITFFQIDKITWNYDGCETMDVTRYFVHFQRLLRRRLALIRAAKRGLRSRELHGRLLKSP
jgi:hypothetical protein